MVFLKKLLWWENLKLIAGIKNVSVRLLVFFQEGKLREENIEIKAKFSVNVFFLLVDCNKILLGL